MIAIHGVGVGDAEVLSFAVRDGHVLGREVRDAGGDEMNDALELPIAEAPARLKRELNTGLRASPARRQERPLGEREVHARLLDALEMAQRGRELALEGAREHAALDLRAAHHAGAEERVRGVAHARGEPLLGEPVPKLVHLARRHANLAVLGSEGDLLAAEAAEDALLIVGGEARGEERLHARLRRRRRKIDRGPEGHRQTDDDPELRVRRQCAKAPLQGSEAGAESRRVRRRVARGRLFGRGLFVGHRSASGRHLHDLAVGLEGPIPHVAEQAHAHVRGLHGDHGSVDVVAPAVSEVRGLGLGGAHGAVRVANEPVECFSEGRTFVLDRVGSERGSIGARRRARTLEDRGRGKRRGRSVDRHAIQAPMSSALRAMPLSDCMSVTPDS